MLTGGDIISGKIMVQLKLASPDDVRAHLRALAQETTHGRDLVNRFYDRKRITDRDVEVVRNRASLYEHVRREATYIRALEKTGKVDRLAVAKLISGLERSAFRKRLGEVLVKQGRLEQRHDQDITGKVAHALASEDQKILERYRAEDFAGVARPLIPGSTLEPDDFKISRLFRGKETRALVDQAELRALREEAAASSNKRAAAEQAKTAEWKVGEDPGESDVAELPDDDDTASDTGEPQKKEDETPAVGMDRVKKMKRIAEYDIIQVLGVGGMGAVFLGQREGTGEYAAIKVMLNEAATEQERGRFLREITLTQRIKHKNVIGIIESGLTKDGLTYLVVPTLVGKELRALIDESKGLGLHPVEVCHVFEQMLDGLAAVHAAHIVHRDLKPENVMLLGKEKTVKIMDFGLAKLDDEADAEQTTPLFRTTAKEIVGSPVYIAPESVTRDPIDARTDIYSLGCMLFEMVTGKLPLESETPEGFLTQHVIAEPATLAEARPEMEWPPELQLLINRMLAKTREERPASCSGILTEFRLQVRPKLLQLKSKGELQRLAEAAELAAQQRNKPPEEEKHGFKSLLGRLWGAPAKK